MNEVKPGTLYLVPTPIGNLADITERAVDVLKEADIIACEDTRHTRILLDHLSIGGHVGSYHEHNKKEAVPLPFPDGLHTSIPGVPAPHDGLFLHR